MNTSIFKTSLTHKRDIKKIEPVFDMLFGEKNWLFAFEDRLLSVVSSIPCVEVVRYLLKERGYNCEEVSFY
ncbi:MULTISPECIES: hypothetical protein [Pedobacter]|uniref:hypothetical protein n=1 Tax=Pedobacter TaxID=84567 RepID=UPI00210C309D|nr:MULTISPECIES: hypothetical protein [unclassified Pedobacter]